MCPMRKATLIDDCYGPLRVVLGTQIITEGGFYLTVNNRDPVIEYGITVISARLVVALILSYSVQSLGIFQISPLLNGVSA